MKKGLHLILLLVIAHHSNSQSNIEFSIENFEREVLSYEATQNDISDQDFNYGKMILSEIKNDVNNNPDNFNCADYYNIVSSFLTLKESDKNLRVAFEKLKSSEGSCDYFRSEKMFDSEKYDRIRTLIDQQISVCSISGDDQDALTGPNEYAKKNKLDIGLVQLIHSINEFDSKYRKDDQIDWEKQHLLDEKNQEQIDSLYTKHQDYLGVSWVGEKYSHVMWSVVQHSNPEMMEKYLPILQKAVADGQINEKPFKMLIDRYYGLKYGYQVFGSQSGFGFELADDKKREEIKAKYNLE